MTLPSGIIVAAPAPVGAAPDLRTSAKAFRQALAGLLKQTSPGVAAPGILPGSASAGQVSGDTTGMKYHVTAAVVVIARGQNSYIFAIPSTQDITLDDTGAAIAIGDATNPRWDRVYAYTPDAELSDTIAAGVYVKVGTPGATPAVPPIPAGSLELGRKKILAGATNTSAGAFTNLAPFTGLNTGIVFGPVDPTTLPDGTIVITVAT